MADNEVVTQVILFSHLEVAMFYDHCNMNLKQYHHYYIRVFTCFVTQSTIDIQE